MQRYGNSEGFHPFFHALFGSTPFLSVSWSVKAIAGICTVANPINMCYMTIFIYYISYTHLLQVGYNLNNTHLRSFLGHPDRRLLEDCLLNEGLEELLRRKLMNGYHED